MMPFTSLPCYSLPSNVFRIITDYSMSPQCGTKYDNNIVLYKPILFKLFMSMFDH